MKNNLLKDPIKIIIIHAPNAINGKGLNFHKYVFLGNVPKYVSSAATQFNDSRDMQSSKNSKGAGILKEYYGTKYKSIFNNDFGANYGESGVSGVSGVSGGQINKSEVSSENPRNHSPSLETFVNDYNKNAIFGGAKLIKNYDVSEFSKRYSDVIDIKEEDFLFDTYNDENKTEVNVTDVGKKVKSAIDSDPDYDIKTEKINLAPNQRLKRVSAFGQADINVKYDYNNASTYVTDVHIYPEDKIEEIKEKLYLASGLPTYRQHVFWAGNNNIQTPYTLISEGVYAVDAMSSLCGISAGKQTPDFAQKSSTQHMFGAPIDTHLYDNRRIIRVEAKDQFITVQNIMEGSSDFKNTFYVIDIEEFVKPYETSLQEAIKDTYQFDLYYYGFVIKYWPQMTTEVFYDFITAEPELYIKYPDLAKSKSYLKTLYTEEAKIINANYSMTNAMETLVRNKHVTLAITQMTVTTTSKKRFQVNIRNLFDKMSVSRCYPQIHAFVEHEGQKYFLKKAHVNNQSDIVFPVTMRQGFTIAISLRKSDQDNFHKRESISTMENEQSKYLFLNIYPDGRYFCRSVWNEEEMADFDRITKTIKMFVNPILEQINSLKRYVFPNGGEFELLAKSNVKYHSLNVCVFWKKVLSESLFKNLKIMLNDYNVANITSTRGITSAGSFSFMFRKGITEFDLSIIDRVISAANIETMKNYYTHYSNNTLKQKWYQLYDGRVVNMSHRITDVKFEVINIKEGEFKIFYNYIVSFIAKALCNPAMKTRGEVVIQDDSKINKLRKLRETDPELYNLKKYGSKKVYSIMCQNPRQPIVYTDDEVANMNKSSLIKFWNMTLNKPAYYACNNKKYPHMAFITGVHPKKYCLPCCSKLKLSNIGLRKDKSGKIYKRRERDTESRRLQINNVCLNKYSFSEADMETSDAIVYKHIMNYGKDLSEGRISKLPNTSLRVLMQSSLYQYNVNVEDSDEEEESNDNSEEKKSATIAKPNKQAKLHSKTQSKNHNKTHNKHRSKPHSKPYTKTHTKTHTKQYSKKRGGQIDETLKEFIENDEPEFNVADYFSEEAEENDSDFEDEILGGEQTTTEESKEITTTKQIFDFYVFGVKQNFPSINAVGILYVVAGVLDLHINELLLQFISRLQQDPKIFLTLLNGTLAESFSNLSEMVNLMRKIFLNNETVDILDRIKFKKWPELFSELASYYFNVHVIVFIDDKNKGDTMILNIPESCATAITSGISKEMKEEGLSDVKFVIVIARTDGQYPIYLMDIDKFFATGKIYKKYFTHSDLIIQRIGNMIKSYNKNNDVLSPKNYYKPAELPAELSQQQESNSGEKSDSVTVNLLVENISRIGAIKEAIQGSKYRIITKYINMHNLCYAILVENEETQELVYLPLKYSANISDGIYSSFDIFKRKNPLYFMNVQTTSLNLTKKLRSVASIRSSSSGMVKNITNDTPSSGEFKVSPEQSSSVFVANSQSLYNFIEYFCKRTISLGKKSVEPIIKAMFSRCVLYDGKVIGFVSIGSLFYFINDTNIENVDPRFESIVKRQQILHYDIEDVNQKILAKYEPQADNRTNKLGESLYHNYMYTLFTLEFVSKVENEINAELRGKIYELIKVTNFKVDILEFQQKLRQLLMDYGSYIMEQNENVSAAYVEDFNTLKLQLAEFYYAGLTKEDFIEMIQGYSYNFDKMVINKLLKMSRKEIKRELEKICATFVHFDNAATNSSKKFTFPNVYMPCAEDDLDYCHVENNQVVAAQNSQNSQTPQSSKIQKNTGSKLIIPRDRFGPFVELLTSDIMNPIKIKYMFSGMFTENIINYFDFTVKSYENVFIKKIAM